MITNGGKSPEHRDEEESTSYGDDVLGLFGLHGEDAHELNAGPVSSINVKRAVQFVDGAKIVDKIMLWQQNDRIASGKRNGGRTSIVTLRTVVILMFVLMLDEKALLISNMERLVAHRMSNKNIARVGLTPAEARKIGLYPRLWRVTHNMIAAFDPFPAKRQSVMNWDEHQALKTKEANDPNVAVKKARLDWFANTLLEASANTLPKEYRTWSGNIALDATLVKTFGKRGFSNKNEFAGFDRNAGYYGRGGDHSVDKDGVKTQSKWAFGYEATLAVQAPNAPGLAIAFPTLAIGMAFHKPGTAIADEARNTIASIVERNYPVGYFLGDLAYTPSSDPEKLQLPLKTFGYKIVSDLRKDQLGVLDNHMGAQLVEGTWYCPSMPKALVEATEVYADIRGNSALTRAVRDEAGEFWASQIESRRKYQLRRKETTVSEDGMVPMMCPAAGKNATVGCPLKENQSKKALMPIAKKNLLPAGKRGKICTNKSSVHFDAKAGAKYEQSLPFGTKEHKAHYALRAVVEGYNGYIKNPNQENLGDAGRRQLRGHAAQYMLTAILVVGSNLRKVQRFLQDKALETIAAAAGKSPKPHVPRKRSANAGYTFAPARSTDLITEPEDIPDLR